MTNELQTFNLSDRVLYINDDIDNVTSCDTVKFCNNLIIKDNKIKFKFNDNNLVTLDPISVIKNNTNNTIEIEFRNVVKEHLEELKSILNKKE